jgi:hypothetical protein
MLRIAAARDPLEALVGAHFNKQALLDDGVLQAAPFLQQPALTLHRLGGHMKKQAVPIGQLASLVARFDRRRLSVRHHPLPPIDVDGSGTEWTTIESKTAQTPASARFADYNGSMRIEEWRKGWDSNPR